MKRWSLPAVVLASCVTQVQAAPDLEALTRQVDAAERSFARSLAERDRESFARYLSDDAVFFQGAGVLHGKAEVAAAWKPFFDAKAAPFSWEPDRIEVIADGTLALSTGPVRDPTGKPIARFNSVWRLEGGAWHVVFDKGSAWEEAGR